MRKYCLGDWQELGWRTAVLAAREAKQESLGFSSAELVFWHSVRRSIKSSKRTAFVGYTAAIKCAQVCHTVLATTLPCSFVSSSRKNDIMTQRQCNVLLNLMTMYSRWCPHLAHLCQPNLHSEEFQKPSLISLSLSLVSVPINHHHGLGKESEGQQSGRLANSDVLDVLDTFFSTMRKMWKT